MAKVEKIQQNLDSINHLLAERELVTSRYMMLSFHKQTLPTKAFFNMLGDKHKIIQTTPEKEAGQKMSNNDFAALLDVLDPDQETVTE